MFDLFVKPLSIDDLTALEESLALLHNELHALPASLRWAELRQMATRRPRKVLSILTELLLDGVLSGVCVYVDERPVGVCLWGISDEEGGLADRPSLACVFIAADYQGRGFERQMLSVAEESINKAVFRKVS